jgi:LmbE family N-acetylglucosaminyl deacetylase
VLSDDELERILVITAHPDDVDFGAGGTVARWTDQGIAVSYCIITDGDAGGFDPSVPRADIPRIRRGEQEAAASVLGVDDLHWLGYADGRLEVTLDLRRDLSRVIRKVRPQRVVCQSPQRNWERIYSSHPDHLAAGEAALCAVYPDARNEFTFTELMAEGHDAWSVPEVWVMSAPQPDHWVDTTETLERTVKALLCHVSQLPDPDGLEDRMVGWGRTIAAAGGLPEGRTAEAFKVVSTA